MNQRQGERDVFFHHFFQQMPLWEVWDTRDTTHTPDVYPPEGKVRHHCKAIPRRLRRQMARVRAKREWRTAKGMQ